MFRNGKDFTSRTPKSFGLLEYFLPSSSRCDFILWSWHNSIHKSYRSCLIRFSSAGETSVFFRKFLFRFVVFDVRIWLRYAFSRFTFPDAVILNDFFALLFVFIFGIEWSFCYITNTFLVCLESRCGNRFRVRWFRFHGWFCFRLLCLLFLFRFIECVNRNEWTTFHACVFLDERDVAQIFRELLE